MKPNPPSNLKVVRPPAKRFHGEPCRSCGETERYVASRACLGCMRRYKDTSRAKMRKLAEERRLAELAMPTPAPPEARDKVKWRKPSQHSGPPPVIQQAIAALDGTGEYRHGAYFLCGKMVSLLTILRAANDMIERKNMTFPRANQLPLIGREHYRWGQ